MKREASGWFDRRIVAEAAKTFSWEAIRAAGGLRCGAPAGRIDKEMRSFTACGIVWLAMLCLGCGCSGDSTPPPTQIEIWAAIQPPAQRYGIEPAFIYALVAAESNFDPKARRGDARGLLQVKPRAWMTVSTRPYEPNVWDWRTNLEVGIDYLAYSRSYIHRQSTFSYPRLLAAFHYGLDYLEERHFDVGRIPVPDNDLYRQLWSGNLAPLAPPK